MNRELTAFALALAALTLVACDEAAPGASVEATTPASAEVLEAALVGTGGAVLGFTGDWRVDLGDEPVLAGGTVRVVYDGARLPRCRGRKYGLETWSIVVHWRGEDGAERYEALRRGDDQLFRADLPVPAGLTDLELWFSNGDAYGCHDWDSDYGRNYRFPVVAASGRAGLAFTAGERPAQTGRIVQRGLVSVDYDLARLSACAKTDGGLRAWSASIGWRFLPDGEQGEAPLFTPWSAAELPLAGVTLQIPSHATALEVWFKGADADGCLTWDSEGGQNHRFAVGPVLGDTQIGWAGGWNSWRARDCRVVEGLEDPARFEKSGAGHDCMALGARVWVPGLTDRDGPADWIQAEVVTDLGFGERLATPTAFPLIFEGRVGNDYRFRWNLTQQVSMSPRGDYSFRFRFSLDGETWVEVGQGDEPGGAPRTLAVRNDSLDR